MSNSPRIGLPYLDAAQAPKHVTMNEALARLNIVAASRVETMASMSPPVSPVDGDGHIVPVRQAVPGPGRTEGWRSS